MTDTDPRAAFIEAACAPLDGWHGAGTLDAANALLAAQPALATTDVYTAAILGDADTVGRFLATDPGAATAKAPPRDWDALTHLCFSRYLRLDPARSAGFVRAATSLLDAGANPNTGWFEPGHQPEPVWESALYGAAGVARHPGLTGLLLERGADPNDEETPYHAPEGYDNEVLELLVASGKLSADSLATILLRKVDWHDDEAVRWLLARGADPNRMTRWGRTALHHALLRDNTLANVDAMLDRGADPTLESGGASTVALAARRGRGDVLAALKRRAVPIALVGADELLAACATDDAAGIRDLTRRNPDPVGTLVARGGRALAEFAGNGNVAGARHLLDLGVDVNARFPEGDGYWDVAGDSTALHVAAWRARHDVVELLIQRSAAVDARDGKGRTPLALAVRACVDSYWKEFRSPKSVELLLRAGASPDSARFPSGYQEVDELLRRHGAGQPGPSNRE